MVSILGMNYFFFFLWKYTAANFQNRWVGAFNAISAFNNSGMSLLDANMVGLFVPMQIDELNITFRSRFKLLCTC